MPRHEDRIRLRHMLDRAVEAVEMAQGKTRQDLDKERQLNLALVRLLEIVGEAANRVCKPTRAEHPAVPWAEIIGLRNRLIHGYEEVDFDVLWRIVAEDLPALIAELRRVLGEEPGQRPA